MNYVNYVCQPDFIVFHDAEKNIPKIDLLEDVRIRKYDNISDNGANFISYIWNKNRIINSFASKEMSREKENYALLFSLNKLHYISN